MNKDKNIVVILGPTAAGKTSLAAALAAFFNGEIISADSRQVYTGMDIGTGKDYKDYIVGNKKINYHLIDVVSPRKEFNLFIYIKKFIDLFQEITARNKTPLLTGGTGLYLDAVLKSYTLSDTQFDEVKFNALNSLSDVELKEILLTLKPVQHNITDLSNRNRMIKAIIIEQSEGEKISTAQLKLNPVIIGISFEREEIKKRISLRLKERLRSGMIEEVEGLILSGISHDKLIFFGLEYKYVSLYLQGRLNYNDMYQKLNSAIIQFAKRQMTWFRKLEKEGMSINWISGTDFQQAAKILEENGFSSKVS